MTLESSASMMDAIFESPEYDNRARLLKLMQDFLVSEAAKHMAQERGFSSVTSFSTKLTISLESTKQKSIKTEAGVNMEELIGNTHGFAESGYARVPPSCSQRL